MEGNAFIYTVNYASWLGGEPYAECLGAFATLGEAREFLAGRRAEAGAEGDFADAVRDGEDEYTALAADGSGGFSIAVCQAANPCYSRGLD